MAANRALRSIMWWCRVSHAMAAMVVVIAMSGPAMAETFTVTPADNWLSTLQNLQAGDTVIFSAGTYQTGGFVSLTLNGTEQAPIVIMGDKSGNRPVIEGVSDQNVFNVGGSHYRWEYLELTKGSHGMRVETSLYGEFVDLKLHDLGDVGLSMNRSGHTYEHMHVTRCEIFDTGNAPNSVGEGMYIGCNPGDCVVSNSRFDFNYVYDMGGSQGDGIEIKKNSHSNVLADNVIVNTNYPGITMYGFDDGVGKLPNIVERNLVWQVWDNGIQVNGQVIVRNNIVIAAGENGANGIHSKPTSPHLPKMVEIAHNTVINAGGACLRTNDWDQADNQIVQNNALYCPGGQAIKVVGNGSTMTWDTNVVVGTVEGNAVVQAGVIDGTTLAADFADAANRDFYPADGSGLIDMGTPTPNGAVDFDGTPRDGSPDIGAYEWTQSGNPNTVPDDGFKQTSGPDPDPPADDPPEAADTAEPQPELQPEPGPEPEGDAGPEPMPEPVPDEAPVPDPGFDVVADMGTDNSASSDVGTSTPGGGEDDGCAGGTTPAVPWVPLAAWLLAFALMAVRRR